MPSIIFIEHQGNEHRIDVSSGLSLMQAAVDNAVPGVIGDCGGNCACATCHGYIAPDWASLLEPADADEVMMLSCAVEPRENSRLLCKIVTSEQLDGLVVHLPVSQY